MIGRAGQWTQTPSTTPLQPKNMKCLFLIMFTSDDLPGWLMNSNPICHPSPSQKNEMLNFWITFNFWWSARLVDGLKPHPPPLFSQKMKSSFLDYVQLLMINQAGHGLEPHLPPLSSQKMNYVQLLIIGQAGRWTQTPSATPLQLIKWNVHFWNFWWSARLVNGLEPHLPPLSSQKNEMLIFGLHYFWMINWSMDSNPICQPSPAKKN